MAPTFVALLVHDGDLVAAEAPAEPLLGPRRHGPARVGQPHPPLPQRQVGIPVLLEPGPGFLTHVISHDAVLPRDSETVRSDRLLQVTAVADAVVGVGLAVGLRDRDALALALAMAAGLLLFRVQRRLGAAALLLLFGNVAFWTISAAASNLGRDEVGPVILPGLLATISLIGGVAAAGCLASAPPTAARGPVRVGRASLLGLVAGAAAVVVVAVAPGLTSTADPEPGDLVIRMRNSRFSVERLEAPAGPISLFVANPDLFWHTVTIPDLDVDVRVPVGGARRATFRAGPGSYDYVCRVPGHSKMQGVLIVGPPSL